MYLITILLLSVFAYIEVFNRETIEKYKVPFAFFCFIFLVIHDGFRWETGSDWTAYLQAFENFWNDNNGSYTGAFESGYMLLMGGIRLLTEDYSVYLVIHALLFYSIFFYVIFKISDYPFISLLLFYMLTVPFMGMNRQFLAMAIFAISLLYQQKGEWKMALLLILLATLFHRTAFLALPTLLLGHKIQRRYILIGYILCLIITMSGIINTFGNELALLTGTDSVSGEKIEIYTNQDTETNFMITILSFLRKMIWLVLLFLFDKKVDKGCNERKYTLLLNLYIISTMSYLVFNGTVLQIIVARGLLYYNLAEMFIIPYAISIFKNNYGKLFLMLLLSLYCTINIYKGFSNYGEGNDYFEPYKGLFINTNYERKYI